MPSVRFWLSVIGLSAIARVVWRAWSEARAMQLSLRLFEIEWASHLAVRIDLGLMEATPERVARVRAALPWWSPVRD
jgi:hypothetical protein